MKELSIEEKARRYDGAIKRLEDIETGKCQKTFMFTEGLFDYIFPELKESEDERIRKELLQIAKESEDSFYMVMTPNKREKLIAWLEKQVHKFAWSEEDKNMLEWVIAYFNNRMLNTPISEERTACKNVIARLEKLKDEQNPNPCDGCINRKGCINCENGELRETEQKSAKVKPKFKVGDYVVGKYISGYISEVRDDCYLLDYQGFSINKQDNYHLWTIRDAKDGDILCTYECDEPKIVFILKGTPKKHYALSYHCYYNIMYPKFGSDSEKGCLAPNDEDVKPATKEQRDLLFQKMREAGYEWDAEKKELKKIVVPIFNIGDSIIKKHNSDINNFGSFTITDITGGKYWYNDRIICDITEQNEWEIYEPVRQKPAEWSEEDDIMKQHCHQMLALLRPNSSELIKDIIDNCHHWLKSLKDRVQPQSQWKPSIAQLNALSIVSKGNAPDDIEAIVSLYQDLKKLRDEQL